MSVLIKHMAMPKGCIYANDKDQTEYCPLLNHDDVPFCQYIETEPEIAIGIDERPVYCPLFDVSESCQDTVSRQAAIDVAKAHWYKPDIVGAIEQLPPAEPEPCLDLIVSEIEETIRETKESGKHHEIHVRTNGAMICFGLQLALEIIEEIRNDKAKEDGKTT